MLCRWLAVLVLAGILLVIEAIAVSQGTFTRDQRVLSGSPVQGSRNVSGVPAFETNVPRNVTTAVSQTAFLHCRVHQLGDKEEKCETEKGAAETSTKEEIIRSTSGEVDKHHSCRWMGVIGLSPFIHFTFIAVEYSQWYGQVQPDTRD
ncbi:uncharacterized protein [Mycetomoellerius zeteki]|uniref:uncharacterized protein n=1 Tax=Mycetomoellerius zeteki TaxID=64791 RepID=UPI00084EACE4|nr:PREDICTED: uncharacterized protein LOC108727463 [Trachymyrmex zeteki]